MDRKNYCKIFIFVLMICPYLLFAQSKNFFNKGKVEINQSIEQIPLNFINDIAIVKVEINGKFYNFLFDTGAPLIISNKIFEELNLKTKEESDVKDTNQEIRKQKFTYLPEMKLGGIKFKNFGAIVIDLEDPLFQCYNIAGIFGANQMAKLFWKVDYQNSLIEASKNIKHFKPEEYKFITRFTPLPQKSPKIYIQLHKENKEVLFDTGFAGSIILSKSQIDTKDPKISKNLINKYGVSTLGMYGVGKNIENFLFKTEEFSIDNIPQSQQIIETGESSVLGNTFLKNYVFILDWENNEILFKPTKAIPIDDESFGFSYKYVKGKIKVLSIYKDQNIPLQLDDEILNINNENMENLTEEEACTKYLMSKEKKENELILIIKRGKEILNLKVKKQKIFR